MFLSDEKLQFEIQESSKVAQEMPQHKKNSYQKCNIEEQ